MLFENCSPEFIDTWNDRSHLRALSLSLDNVCILYTHSRLNRKHTQTLSRAHGERTAYTHIERVECRALKLSHAYTHSRNSVTHSAGPHSYTHCGSFSRRASIYKNLLHKYNVRYVVCECECMSVCAVHTKKTKERKAERPIKMRKNSFLHTIFGERKKARAC